MTLSAPAQNASACEAGSGNGFVVHEVEQDFGDLKATDLNVFSHCLPHSAQLFRFSALQFDNEASGHLNHKPLTSTCHYWRLGGSNQRRKALLTGFEGCDGAWADIDPTLCSARCGILHDELRL